MNELGEVVDRVETMPIRTTIVAQFRQVADEQEKEVPPLTDDLVLADTDLDSLCFAIIVARLEDALGFDPFAAEESESAAFPVTFGDFVRFYETCADAAG